MCGKFPLNQILHKTQPLPIQVLTRCETHDVAIRHSESHNSWTRGGEMAQQTSGHAETMQPQGEAALRSSVEEKP